MENSLTKDIGLRIRARREELKLTRERLAELSDVSVQFLRDVERGDSNMTTVTLAKIAPALGLSCDYIIFGVANEDCANLAMRLSRLTSRDRKLAEDILNAFITSANSAK